MRGSLRIFRLFGIDVKLHFSWWFIAILIAWSLSTSFFPFYFPEQTAGTYWFMGITAAILLFVSVVLHELSHSLVARARKIKVESITLFFFGGVAGIEKEDLEPKAEFQMAVAGPLFSFLLAGIFYFINKSNGNLVVEAITFYLYQLNFILAVFNLVPGFPLDGGRAFRALLFAYYKDLRKATKIAAAGGKVFAGILVALGFLGLLSGVGNGLWFLLLGIFLYFIAGVSYEQVIVKEVLHAIPLKELLERKHPVLKGSLTFQEFVKKRASGTEDVFLVKDGKFLGILDSKHLDPMEKKMQGMMNLRQLSVPLSSLKGLGKEDTAYTAFRRFAEQNIDLLPVMEGKRLLGTVSRKRVMHRLVWGLKYGG